LNVGRKEGGKRDPVLLQAGERRRNVGDSPEKTYTGVKRRKEKTPKKIRKSAQGSDFEGKGVYLTRGA